MRTHSLQTVDAPITALRLHARHPAPGLPTGGRVTELLDLAQREAKQQATQQAVRDLAAVTQEVVEAMPGQVGARLDEVAALAVELGLQIAREVVGNAIDRGLVDLTAVVARCLRDCVHGSSRADLVVRLHPEDLALVEPQLATRSELQDELGRARFVADATVRRGAVRAETDTGRLRYDARDAVERVCAEVRREVCS